MQRTNVVSIFVSLFFAACSSTDTTADMGVEVDATTPVVGPDGAIGLCCPVSNSCDCSYKGGWALTIADCPRVCDQGPGEGTRTDEYGCNEIYGNYTCFGPPDGGLDAAVDSSTADLGSVDDAAIDSGAVDLGNVDDAGALDGSEPMTAAELCTSTGGSVTSGLCCAATGDFPSSCSVGACGCAPGSSHEIQKCECPSSTCFDPGVGCTPTT